MLTVAGRGGNICKNLADVICERSLTPCMQDTFARWTIGYLVYSLTPRCGLAPPPEGGGAFSRIYCEYLAQLSVRSTRENGGTKIFRGRQKCGFLF